MTFSPSNRRTATVLTAALALGAAGPAAAQPVGNRGPVLAAPSMHVTYHGRANVLPPFVPRHVEGFAGATAAPVPTVTPRAVSTHPGAGESSDLVYIVVGGVLVALGGLGGTLAVANRRRTAPARARIAA